MKKIICLLMLAAIAGIAQGSPPVMAAIGIKPGMNITTYNPDDDLKNYSGIGFNLGFGLVIDVGNIGIELTPSYRSTDYRRTVNTIIGDISNTWHYNNFYMPIRLRLKTGELGAVAPFLGLGFALDVQTDGYTKFNNGNPIDVAEADLQNDFFLSISLGADVRQDHFRIAPEFAFDYNLTPEIWETNNQAESNFDFTISIGFFFVP